MERIPASERTREKSKALMDGRAETTDERSELVRLAARLIIEEALDSCGKCWRTRRDSNSRPLPSEGSDWTSKKVLFIEVFRARGPIACQ